MPLKPRPPKHLVYPLFTALAVASASVCHGAAVPIRAGLWEITVSMELPGMPLGLQPLILNNCLTEAQVRNPDAVVAGLNAPGQDGNCKVDGYRIEGNTATWTMSCNAPQAMRGEGRIIFENANAYHGAVNMQMGSPTAGMSMMQRVQGRRIGDCKA